MFELGLASWRVPVLSRRNNALDPTLTAGTLGRGEPSRFAALAQEKAGRNHQGPRPERAPLGRDSGRVPDRTHDRGSGKNGEARLNPKLKAHMHPLPADLSQRYGAAPSGYLYGVIGGNVVMRDGTIRSTTCSALMVRADSSKDALGQSKI